MGGPGEAVSRAFDVDLAEGPAEVIVSGCACRVDDFALLAPSQARGVTQSAFFAWAVAWKRQADARTPPTLAPPAPCGCKGSLLNDPKT